MKINIESQKQELQDINNQLTLLMKKKKAIQEYLKEETNRMTGIKSVEDKIIELYNINTCIWVIINSQSHLKFK